jgi:D-beta-D-heptose 7-phosphate kinase/D-beta-D-heptose 1-phosphate adenosyltransferase
MSAASTAEVATLLTRLADLAGARVAVAGDVMLDRFVEGRVDRISPEAPVPVLRVEHETAMPGGAGNVMRNVIALGGGASLTGVVGADAAAGELRALVAAAGASDATLITDAGRETTVKTRFLGGSQQMLRTDRESALPLPPAVRALVIDAVEALLHRADVLLLSDYGKGVFADGVAEAMLSAAGRQRKPAVVDPKGLDFRRYRGAAVVTPNRRELADALRAPVAPGEEAAAARRLLADSGLGAVLVTLGKDGMLLVPAEGEATRLAAEARAVFDVSGAGDTVAAAVALGLAAGLPLALAARLANVAAGIVVGKVGTAIVRAAEVADTLRRQEPTASADKIATWSTAGERIALWRRQGLAVGFTNGCFDLLHPGHVALIRQAKEACDRLVVGLNSDASVARLKGAGRPVQPEAARAIVLASLAAVDLVVTFGEDTPSALIAALRPDVLVKGADYRREDVVGGDIVERYGGRVMLARLEPGYSTSDTVARLRRAEGKEA